MKTTLPLLSIIWLWPFSFYAQNCPVQIPQDTFVCAFSYTLEAHPAEGSWTNLCDLSVGVADFFTINDSLTSITVAECGDYFLKFEYAQYDTTLTLDTVSTDPLIVDTILMLDTLCLTSDTMRLTVNNPATAEFDLIVNVTTRYPEASCIPNDTVHCESSFRLRNPEPPEMEWTFYVLGLCQTTQLSTTVVDVQDCQAEQILFESTSFTGTLGDTTTVFNNRFVEIDPVSGDIVSNPFQAALGQVINEAIVASSEVCPLPIFCDNSPPWCIDTLRDTSILMVPVRAGGVWQIFPDTDSVVVLMDTTLLTISDSTFMFVAQPSANAYDARFDIFQIDYAGDTIPSIRPGIITLQWEEHWGMDTFTQIVPRLVDTCCGGGLNVRTEVFDPPPPVYDCEPFQVIFIEELKTTPTILECDQDVYSLRVAISGGIPPYVVSGLSGTLEDSIFTAEAIPISSGFSLTVTDQGDCSTTVEGDACSCVDVEAVTDTLVPLRCDTVCAVLTGEAFSALSDSLFFHWERDTIGMAVAFGDSIQLCDTGHYRFVATEFYSGCIASVDVIIEQNIPVADPGDSLTLNCNTPILELGGEELSVGPTLLYAWSGPGIDMSNQHLANPEISLAGIYELVVIDTANVCSDTSFVSIDENFIPPIADAGEDHFISCHSENFQLGSSNSSMGENIEYKWIGPHFNDPDDILHPVANLDGTYILVVRDLNNGCISRDTAIIHPFDSIQFTATATPSCWNDDTGVVTFENVSGGQAPYSYSVGGVLFRPLFVIDRVQSGTFELVVKDRRGCESSSIIEIGEIPSLTNPPVLQEEFHICGPIELELDLTRAVPEGDSLRYRWSDGTILPTNQFSEPGDYQVIASSICETFVSDFKIIDDSDIADRFQVPNIFSPNEDGVNDVFRPLTSLEIEDYELVVYNRWGQKVFQSVTLENGWDGNINGKTGLSDVYVWTISAKMTICDGENNQLFLKGDLTLLR